jgi:TonB family protein
LDNSLPLDKQAKGISKYNELVAERERLLKTVVENNPKLKSLDEQIGAIEKSMTASIKKETKSQADADTIDVPFFVVDEVPVFPGCEARDDKRACFNEMIQQHIAKNFKYPKEAQEKGIQGRVHTLFTIGRDGVVKNLKMRGLDPLLENEAKRIIDLLPNMTPGKQSGKEVNVPFSVPITFKLMTTETASDAAPTTTVSSKIYVVASTYMEGGKRFIKGVVSDGQKGLPGVNIEQKGSSSKIVTDFNGDFVTVVNTGDELVFQYLNLPLVVLEISDKAEYKVADNNVLIGLPDNEKPTYFIDGVETTMEYIQTIDPEAIASVAVLKGKSAQDKYGEKGKNGVIEITLKNKE